MWGFVKLEDDWPVLKQVLDTLDERNSENSPESSRRPTDNVEGGSIQLSTLQDGGSRRGTHVPADPA